MASEGQGVTIQMPQRSELQELREFEQAIRDKRGEAFGGGGGKAPSISNASGGGDLLSGLGNYINAYSGTLRGALAGSGEAGNQAQLLLRAFALMDPQNYGGREKLSRSAEKAQELFGQVFGQTMRKDNTAIRGAELQNALLAEQLKQTRLNRNAPGVAREGGFNADRGPGVSLGGDMMMAPGGGSDYLSRLMQKKQRADLERALRQGVRDERRDLEAEKAAQIEADRKAAAFNLVMKGLMKVVGKL